MRRKKWKGSYTIEAAIYIPMIIFLLFYSLKLSIDYWQESREKVVSEIMQELDVVKEFYIYQMMDEIGRELDDGAT